MGSSLIAYGLWEEFLTIFRGLLDLALLSERWLGRAACCGLRAGTKGLGTASGEANGEYGIGFSASELRKVRGCVGIFAGVDNGEGVVIELLPIEARNA